MIIAGVKLVKGDLVAMSNNSKELFPIVTDRTTFVVMEDMEYGDIVELDYQTRTVKKVS